MTQLGKKTSLWTRIRERGKPLLTILVIILLLWLLWETIRLDNLGFDGYVDPNGEYHRAKTLWDWVELFILPIVLAIGAWWLNKSARENEQLHPIPQRLPTMVFPSGIDVPVKSQVVQSDRFPQQPKQ